jgi:hypothetical protein
MAAVSIDLQYIDRFRSLHESELRCGIELRGIVGRAADEQESLLVPDAALGSDQGGRYLLVLDQNNTVEQRKVTIGPRVGDLRVIESGLKPDDRLVVAGILRAIPGQKVDPQLETLAATPASAAGGK